MANDKNMLYVIIFVIIVIILVKIGPSFMGTLVTLEGGGNEIKFYEKQYELDAEGNQVLDSAGNPIISQVAVNKTSRYFQMESKYVESAIMRIYGTDGLEAAIISLTKNEVDEDGNLIPTSTPIWATPETGFDEVEELDLTTELDGLPQGSIVSFDFLGIITSGYDAASLIITEFDVEWGPTDDQVSTCMATGGTFDQDTLICTCPDEDEGGNAFESQSLETGCVYETPVIDDDDDDDDDGGGTGGGTIVADECKEEWSCTGWVPETCPVIDTQYYIGSGVKQTRTCTDKNNCKTPKNKPPVTQSCEPYVSKNTMIIIGLVLIALIIYYLGFESGPNRGLFRRAKRKLK